MSKIYKTYLNAIEKNLKVFSGNWLPGTPRTLGDYGTIEQGIFTRIGNIEDIGVSFETVEDTSADVYNFSSGTSLSYSGGAGASVDTAAVSANASVKISFSKSASVFFNAAGCVTTMIKNIDQIEEAINTGHKNDKFKWKNAYRVVTSLVDSAQTIVVISTSKSAGMTLAAASPSIEKIDLSDASLDLNVTSSSDVGFSVDAEKGLQPLLGLTKVTGLFT